MMGRSLPPPVKFLRNLTTLEEESIKEEYRWGTLSKMYKIVMETSIGALTTLPNLRQWEGELRKCFTETEKKKMLKLVHYLVVSAKYQESGFKIMTIWYLTLEKLYRLKYLDTDICGRYNRESGTMLHMFWTCEKIRSF